MHKEKTLFSIGLARVSCCSLRSLRLTQPKNVMMKFYSTFWSEKKKWLNIIIRGHRKKMAARRFNYIRKSMNHSLQEKIFLGQMHWGVSLPICIRWLSIRPCFFSLTSSCAKTKNNKFWYPHIRCVCRGPFAQNAKRTYLPTDGQCRTYSLIEMLGRI